MKKKTLVNFIQQVNSADIYHETIDGMDHIIIPSYTMPDDIVLHGGLYPAKEIEATINSLEGAPAPLGHPKFSGKYVSAYDQRSQNAFGIGAFNRNVTREGNRWKVEKVVNTEIAKQTERGQALLDAIDKGEPIHSSTGVMLARNTAAGENKYGKYNWQAKINHFDHDAILLNEAGAATPEQGVGLMVNSQGEADEFDVLFVNLSSGLDMSGGTRAVREKLRAEVRRKFATEDSYTWVEDFNADTVIFEQDDKLFSVGYTLNGDTVTIDDEATQVEAKVSFEESRQPGMINKIVSAVVNALNPNHKQKEIDPMKQKMIAALNAASITTDGMSDDQIFDRYNQQMTVNSQQPKAEGLTAESVTKMISDGIAAGFAANEAKQQEGEKAGLVEKVVNAKVVSKEIAETMNVNQLRALAPKPKAAGLAPNSAGGNEGGEDEFADVDLNANMEEK